MKHEPADEGITVNDEQAPHLFSNLISVHVNPEEACLGIGIRDVAQDSQIMMQHYVHLTIPHFVRFAQAVNQQLQLLVDKGVVTPEYIQ